MGYSLFTVYVSQNFKNPYHMFWFIRRYRLLWSHFGCVYWNCGGRIALYLSRYLSGCCPISNEASLQDLSLGCLRDSFWKSNFLNVDKYIYFIQYIKYINIAAVNSASNFYPVEYCKIFKMAFLKILDFHEGSKFTVMLP